MKPKWVAYVKWIEKTRRCKQGLLVECLPPKVDTPEHFYYQEMDMRSTLYNRCKAHGVKIKGEWE